MVSPKGIGTTVSLWKRVNLTLILYHTKINFTGIIGLNIRAKTIKLIEENLVKIFVTLVRQRFL